MRTLKQNSGRIVLCLIEVIIGILLLVNPVGFTSGIIIALGVIFLAFGIFEIVKYFRTSAVDAALQQSFVKGLLGIIFGLFLIIKSDWFIVTFPVLTILYGIANLLIGLFKVQLTVDAIRLGFHWAWTAFSAIVTLAFAVIILLNPFDTTVFLWKFIAITLMVEAILDLLSILFWKSKDKKPTSEKETIYVDQ